MNYNDVTQVLALIFISVAALKILVILIKPSAWGKVIKKVWKNSNVMMVICLVLAALVLYLLLGEGFTLIDIFAVALFVSLLAGAGIAMYSQDVVVFATRLLKGREIVKKSWLYILIWVILILCGFKILYM